MYRLKLLFVTGYTIFELLEQSQEYDIISRMASRRRKLQRSQSTSISTHGSLNSIPIESIGNFEASNTLSKEDRSSNNASFRRILDSFRRKNNSENNNIVDKLQQYSWKYATWSSKRSKSMPDVEQHDKLMNNNQSLNEELNENGAKNNFSWSETSGVKIIRSLSDLNQALGKFILI